MIKYWIACFICDHVSMGTVVGRWLRGVASDIFYDQYSEGDNNG